MRVRKVSSSSRAASILSSARRLRLVQRVNALIAGGGSTVGSGGCLVRLAWSLSSAVTVTAAHAASSTAARCFAFTGGASTTSTSTASSSVGGVVEVVVVMVCPRVRVLRWSTRTDRWALVRGRNTRARR